MGTLLRIVVNDGSAARGRVLVVEDDPATSRFLSKALGRAGFTVAAAGDVEQALAELAGAGWDAVLVDVGLPGASGFDLVRQLRQDRPDLPVALMTADASMDVAVQALRHDVDDFLPKPIDPDTLVTQVGRLVLRRGAQRRSSHRVLGIGAHPDDVEIGVGGILFGHHHAGDELAVLTMSHGAVGGSGSERSNEAARAADLLGARLYLEGLEDTHISEGNPTVGLIEAVIADFDPMIVYTHSWHDLHQDHRNTHRATMVAARGVPSVYCYESPSATVEFQPARFVAIDAYIDGKMAVIDSYKSQVELRAYLDAELVRATSRYWGRYGDSRYCEPLEVVRERSPERSPVLAPGGVTHGAP